MSNIDNNENIENREDIMPKILEKELKHHKSHPISIAVWFGIVFGVASSVFIGWNFIAPKFRKTEQTEVPLIRRSTSPVKVRPSDPGGMDIPNRDRRVYARIETGYDEPVVERLLPPPEEPMAPEFNIINENEEEYSFENNKDIEINKDASIENLIDAVKKTEVIKQPKETKIETKIETKAEPKTEPKLEIVNAEPKAVPVIEAKTAPKVEVKTNNTADIKKELSKPIAITPETTSKTKETTGIWKVQLLSVKDKEAAQKEWQNILQKHSTILAGISHIIEEANLGEKGIFYRLKVGGYDDRTKAENLCAKLKEKKQGCFVVK